MIWASPWAWALAVAAALPVVAHLWSRKRPATLQFPTLRFLRAASPISRRLHRVQDWPMLLVRLAAVAMICAAAAGPTVSSSWRREAWRQRLHRIIVVDAAVGGDRAAAVVANLQQTASSSTVIGPGPIRDVLDEALAQAGDASHRRRTEVVLVFDGTQAAVGARDVGDVPASVGVRLVVVDRSPDPQAPPAANAGADVLIEGPAGRGALSENMRAHLARLMLPRAATPITVGWVDVPPPRAADNDRRRAALAVDEALDAVAADPRVREAAERSDTDPREPGPDSHDARIAVLAWTPDGRPLLRGWSDGRGLALDLDALPRSPLTWWAAVSAREALTSMELDSGKRWNAGELARANREAPVPPESSLPGGLDTRLAWGLALALLAAEQIWRRRRAAPTEQTSEARAAKNHTEASDAA